MAGEQPKQSKPPLISVVTVTLNAGVDLMDTVESVARQSFGDYEHIIKDGGSTDGTVGPSLTEANSRARIVSQADGGIYDAMNQALPHCRGRYVLFLNAGDTLIDEDVLQKLAAASCAHPEAGLLFFDLQNQELRATINQPPTLSRFFLFRNTLCHQAMLVQARWYAQPLAFNTGFRVCADHEWLLRAIGAGMTCRHVPIVGVCYKGGGYSSRADLRRVMHRETEALRRRHFSRAERVIWSAVVGATLPRLRIAVLSSPFLKPLRPAYVALVSAITRVRRPEGRGRRE